MKALASFVLWVLGMAWCPSLGVVVGYLRNLARLTGFVPIL